MDDTEEQRRVPLAEAYRIATGHEPPPPMTDQQLAEFEAKVEKAWEDARRIYGDPDLGITDAA
jgi:hypothetical protein